MAVAWTGKLLTSSNLCAPTYWEIIEEMALRTCPKTHTSIDINALTIPTAAKLSVALLSIFPIMAVSVIDRRGSAIPAMRAGIANLLMFLKRISVFK